MSHTMKVKGYMVIHDGEPRGGFIEVREPQGRTVATLPYDVIEEFVIEIMRTRAISLLEEARPEDIVRICVPAKRAT